jgi:hypothetical protein
MDENAAKSAFSRLTSGALSIFLTVTGPFALAGIAALSAACAPVVNDWSDHTKNPASAYRTGLAAGNSSSDLLKNDHFSKIAVEIQSVHGYAPTAEALTHLQGFLEARLNKPGGVTIVNTGNLPAKATTAPSTSGGALPAESAGTTVASGPSYSANDVQALEHRYRRMYPKKDQFAAYVLFLDGASADDPASTTGKTLGQAGGNTSIVVYENTLRAAVAANTAVQPWVVEATVMEHEFGKLLGLVHAPTSDIAHHEDMKHPGHCSSPSCLMYHGNDTTDYVTGLTGPSGSFTPPSLDSNCLQDLKTAGGK